MKAGDLVVRIRLGRPSLAYLLGLVVVAFVMLLLPASYVGLILLTGWGLWHHVTTDLFILESTSGPWLGLPLYFGPIALGLTLLVFMVKPLFAGVLPPCPPVALDAGQERSLFAFIERICRMVGAPVPRRVEVDCAVNAAAGFRRGAASLLGHDLTLRIGLPLAAGLSTEQFACVLAHEFGHFSQNAGMRLTYLIHRVNRWLFRVVYERDRFDLALERSARAAGFCSALAWHALRFGVWLTRRVLWVLLQAGHAVSCYMLRQMEYDADRCAAQVGGSHTFRETTIRIRELQLAGEAALAALRGRWRAQRLPDSLPHFIVGTFPGIAVDVREQYERSAAESKTRIFDTHPCHGDRIRAAERLGAAGAIRSTEPAAILFRDFASLSRRVTRLSYEKEQRLTISRHNLVDTETCLREASAMRAALVLGERYFHGVTTLWHPISIAAKDLLPSRDPDAGVALVRSARDRMQAAAETARRDHEEISQIEDRLVKADGALALLTAGVAVDPARFELERGASTPGAVAQVIAGLEDRRKRSGRGLASYSAVATDRLRAALGLLGCEPRARRIADADALRDEVPGLVQVLAVLAPALPTLRDISRKLAAWQLLLSEWGGCAGSARAKATADDLARRLRRAVRNVTGSIRGVPYPFPHARGKVTLDEFVQLHEKPRDEQEEIFNESLACVDRLPPLYLEVLGRLAQIAAQVEDALPPAPTRGPGRTASAPSDLMARLREVASRLGPEALAARRRVS
jgi:hypothetical protein